MLRLLTEMMGIGVRKDKDTVVTLDRAELRAHVTWQAGVTLRVHVARPDALTYLEARVTTGISAGGAALRDHPPRHPTVGSEGRD